MYGIVKSIIRIGFPVITALVVVVAGWMLFRALTTGNIAVNGVVRNRSRNPAWYWLGIIIAAIIVFGWGGGLLLALRD